MPQPDDDSSTATDPSARRRSSSGSSRSYRSGGYRSRSRRRRRIWSYLAPLLAVIVVVAGCLYWVSMPEPMPPASTVQASPKLTPKPTERTAALPKLNLPADDAPHGSAMEWWYYNGILAAQSGDRYAFHVAVFVANSLVKHTVMHVALTDLQSGKRYAAQTRTAGSPAARGTPGFDFRQDALQVTGAGDVHQINASFDGAAFALDLKDANPPVAHRAAGSETPGLLDFGDSGISYYYSRPRIATKGTITLDGKPVAVSGDVWFDHQWGEFDVLTLGWNWFALHLADGSDLMLYDLFDAKGNKVMTAGTLSSATGVTPIAPSDIEVTPVARWTSPRTRVSYVTQWRVKLPSGTLDIAPMQVDSEFDASATSANLYWEGPVKVTGSTSGEGFMELSGYERLAAPSSAPSPARN